MFRKVSPIKHIFNADKLRFILWRIFGNLRSRKIFHKINLEISWKVLLFLSVIVIFGLLQTALLDYLKVFNARPDLIIISVLMCSLFFKLRQAIFFSIFAGILKDTLSLNSFGLNTLLFPLLSFMIVRLSRQIPLESNFIRALCVFICVVINDIMAIVMLLFSGIAPQWGIILRTVFMDSLYTALALPLAFKALSPVLYADKKF